MEEIEKTDVEVQPVELTGSRKRLKERYPDAEPADDAGWEELNTRYMDETDAEIGKYKDSESKMTELIGVYPEFGELVFNMIEGKMPLRAAIAKVFSQEDLIPQEGDDDYEAYKKAYGERVEQKGKRDAQTKEIEENESKSMEAIDQFAADKGLSDEQKESLIELINNHFTELLYKRISTEMLEGFLKQMSFDTAVADAEKVGEIRGRNENIEAKMTKEKKKEEGDGLPNAGGGGAINADKKPKSRSFFDIDVKKGI
ncbi:MAG: hypothetical protein NC410_08930 [Oscillibacter sp.]|nr:hypothetical protein [Oscillibacter sp.]